jgi:hypothetical protein
MTKSGTPYMQSCSLAYKIELLQLLLLLLSYSSHAAEMHRTIEACTLQV